MSSKESHSCSCVEPLKGKKGMKCWCSLLPPQPYIKLRAEELMGVQPLHIEIVQPIKTEAAEG